MKERYDLVLGRKEEDILRREIWAATLGAWTCMLTSYVVTPTVTELLLVTPGKIGPIMIVSYVLNMCGFQIIKAILSTMFWYFSPDMSKSESRGCSVCARSLVRKTCYDILWITLSFVLVSTLVSLWSMPQYVLSTPNDRKPMPLEFLVHILDEKNVPND